MDSDKRADNLLDEIAQNDTTIGDLCNKFKKELMGEFPTVPTGIEKYAATLKCTEKPSKTPGGTLYKDDVYIGRESVRRALVQIDFIYKQLKKDAPVTNLEEVQRMSSKELAAFIFTEAKKCISGVGDPVQELIEWLESPV